MATRYTSFGVDYYLLDVEAKDDATYSAQKVKSFSDLSQLQDQESSFDYMTVEHNSSFLDESLAEFPDSPSIAFFSSEKSKSDGTFTNNPILDISFTDVHSTFALTLFFQEVHPLNALVTWYFDNTVIYRREYDIDDEYCIIQQDVQNYNHIVIEFTRAIPYHYVILSGIRYGMILYWNESNIKSGSLVQEINRLSDKLSINTLNFDVIDVANNMNFGNVNGLHNYYQKGQAMYPYEIINGVRLPLGKYYLDTFSSDSNLGRMRASSILGILEDIQYVDGTIYNGITAADLIADIFSYAGITDYTIDSETSNQLLYGTIAPQSCRNALKEVLFACNSIIDTTDIDQIKIYKSTDSTPDSIPRDIKFSTKVTEREYVTGIELKYDTFTLGADLKDITRGIYTRGFHKVVFSSPYASNSITITNATLTKASTYYTEFTVNADSAEVVLRGRPYERTTNSIIAERELIPVGKRKLEKSFSTSLCNTVTGLELAHKILNYYEESNLEIDIQYLADDFDINSKITIENEIRGLKNYIGMYTKRSINLTGGYIDTAKLYGYFDLSDHHYFAGDGLYGDDNFLI